MEGKIAKSTPQHRVLDLLRHLFVEYGAGISLFDPIIRHRLWNRAAWILIALGIVFWAVFLFWARAVS